MDKDRARPGPAPLRRGRAGTGVRRGRRLRRWLGLPRLSTRAWLLAILALLGLIYAGSTVLGDLIVQLGSYGPSFYEPKDKQRQEMLEKQPPGQ